MPRYRTTKTQLSGYKFSMQRREDAFVRRDTRLLDSPFSSHSMATGLGLLAVCLIALAGFVISMFSPQGKLGDSSYVVTKSGSQYVKYNNAWHPVTNSVSASLITGSPAEPKSVDDKSLNNEEKGMFMGIASAPSQIIVGEDRKPQGSVCSAEIGKDPLDPESEFRVDTIYAAGDSLDMKKFSESDVALITVADKSKYWLIFNGKRAEVSMEDDTIRGALGIDSEAQKNAIVVSPKFLNAIPSVPRLTPPALGSGQSGIQGYSVGTVITQEMPDVPSNFYVVTEGGIQQINEALGRILVTAGSDMVRNPSVATINNAPKTDDINLGNFPSKMPSLRSEKTVCAQWSRPEARGKGKVELFAGDVIELKDTDKTREDLTPTITGGDGPSIDRYYPGKESTGWFYQTTDLNDESVTESAIFYVSPEGIRYPIGGDEQGDVNATIQALGLEEKTPVYMPWQYLQLLPEGPTLSQTNALTLWESIPSPKDQLVPKKDGSGDTQTSTQPTATDEEEGSF